MTDLVAKLRAPRPRPGYPDPLPPHPWMVEAADEIERLTASRDGYRETASQLVTLKDRLEAERDRLRADLDETVKAFNECVAQSGDELRDMMQERDRLRAALTDLEMAVSDLMREKDFKASETLSCALDIARQALAGGDSHQGIPDFPELDPNAPT